MRYSWTVLIITVSLHWHSRLNSPTTMSRNGVCFVRNITHNIRFYSSIYRSITVRPSLRPYSELAVISPGVFKIPKKPFDMTVKYIDTSPYEPKPKTVVAIHGAPGGCEYFEVLGKHFEDSETVRVIAPSFPDFKHTRENKFFWHTTPEKVNFLRQFLEDLKIDTIDCLVCHSYGAQALVALWDNPEQLKIRSVCMFAPQPMFDKTMLNHKKSVRRLFLFNNNLWYKFLQMMKLYEKSPFTIKFNDIDELLIVACFPFDDMTHNFEKRFRRVIQNTDIPASILFGSGEKLITKDARDKLNKILGVRLDQIVQLDDARSTPNDVVEPLPQFNSYYVEGAGHFVHIKNSQFAHRMIENLLAKC